MSQLYVLLLQFYSVLSEPGPMQLWDNIRTGLDANSRSSVVMQEEPKEGKIPEQQVTSHRTIRGSSFFGIYKYPVVKSINGLKSINILRF